MLNNLQEINKTIIEPFLSVNSYSTLMGALFGSFATYKLTIGRERMIEVKDTCKILYASFYIRLSAIRTNIEVQKKQHGKGNFRKLNDESRKNNNISLIAKQIMDVSDEIRAMISNHTQNNFNTTVISRYWAVEQIEKEIEIIENSGLGFGRKKKMRQIRTARLYYELACAKISFVQSILEDMRVVQWSVWAGDKETRTTLKFLIRECKEARRRGISKDYGVEESKSERTYDKVDALAV